MIPAGDNGRDRRSAPRSLSLALTTLLALPGAADAEADLGVDARWRHDDNVGSATETADAVSDSITAAKLALSERFLSEAGYTLVAGAELDGETYARLHGLDNATLTAALSLRRKWGLGAHAPWARIGISAGHTDYDDSYRNASSYRATAAAGRRLDPRWALTLDYGFERRHAATQASETPGISGDAFSQRSHALTLTALFTASDRILLSAEMLARHGDVTSTTPDDYGSYAAPRAVAADPAFGSEAYAYRVVGTTLGFRIGLHYAPTAHQSVGVGYAHVDTHAGGNERYAHSVPDVTWDYRF